MTVHVSPGWVKFTSRRDTNVTPRTPCHLGVVVKRLRESRSLSLKQVADRIPCDKSFIWRLEHGQKHGTISFHARFADVLGLTREERETLIDAMGFPLDPPMKGEIGG